MDLGRLFRRRKEPALIHVALNARVQPMHRFERFEIPLEEELARRHVDTYVEGGGTTLDADLRITGCDLVVATRDPNPRLVVHSVVAALELIGVPRGSRVEYAGEVIEFGNHDGVLVTLPAVTTIDGVDARQLPRNAELDPLLKALRDALRGVGSVRSFAIHRGHDTEIYLYGPDGDAVREVAEAVLADHPLGIGRSLEPLS